MTKLDVLTCPDNFTLIFWINVNDAAVEFL
jgi:hypothetical protein